MNLYLISLTVKATYDLIKELLIIENIHCFIRTSLICAWKSQNNFFYENKIKSIIHFKRNVKAF